MTDEVVTIDAKIAVHVSEKDSGVWVATSPMVRGLLAVAESRDLVIERAAQHAAALSLAWTLEFCGELEIKEGR